MKCIKCEGEWTPPLGKTLTECPFCKESFAPIKIPKTYENARDALRFIVDTYGAEALLTKNLFSDIAPNLKDAREMIKMLMGNGALEVLKDALNSSPSEQGLAIKRAVAKLPSYLQHSPDVISLMNDFADVLNWQEAKHGLPNIFHTIPAHQSATSKLYSPNINKNILLGGYDWRVLDIQNGLALLLSDKIIEKRRYHSSLTAITWADCELRGYLNGAFYDSIGEDRARIAETQLSNSKNLWVGTIVGNSTRDKIFLLSLDEVDKYFGNSGDYENKRRKKWNSDSMKFLQDNDGWYVSNNHDQSRIADGPNGEDCWWWLRSPGNKNNSSALVNANGLIRVDGNIVTQNSGGIRPALWLNL